MQSSWHTMKQQSNMITKQWLCVTLHFHDAYVWAGAVHGMHASHELLSEMVAPTSWLQLSSCALCHVPSCTSQCYNTQAQLYKHRQEAIISNSLQMWKDSAILPAMHFTAAVCLCLKEPSLLSSITPSSYVLDWTYGELCFMMFIRVV